jgi:hypothetical protein
MTYRMTDLFKVPLDFAPLRLRLPTYQAAKQLTPAANLAGYQGVHQRQVEALITF